MAFIKVSERQALRQEISVKNTASRIGTGWHVNLTDTTLTPVEIDCILFERAEREYIRWRARLIRNAFMLRKQKEAR